MNSKLAFLLQSIVLFACFNGALLQEQSSPSSSTSTTIAPSSSTSTSTIAIPTSSIRPSPACSAQPSNCQCFDNNQRYECTGKINDMTIFPDLSGSDIKEIVLNDTSIKQIEAEKLPLNVERILLISNPTTFTKPRKKAYITFPKLTSIRIKLNEVPLNFSYITEFFRFTELKVLKLTKSQVEFPEVLFPTSTKLEIIMFNRLNIINSQLKPDLLKAFSNLKNVTIINSLYQYFSDKFFVYNDKLEYVDLSNNSLIEVPSALRACPKVKSLKINQNGFTSLRNSDFLNKTQLVSLQISDCKKLSKIDEYTFDRMPNLEELTITNNPSLSLILKDAFSSFSYNHSKPLNINMEKNNLSTLPSDLFNNVNLKSINLANNPWNCNCDLVWFKNNPLIIDSTIHCNQPKQFKGLEFRSIINSISCQEESLFTKIVLEVFLVVFILLLLAGAVLLQKRYQIGRKLFWRDQFGTIYYTKASFEPSEPHPLT